MPPVHIAARGRYWRTTSVDAAANAGGDGATLAAMISSRRRSLLVNCRVDRKWGEVQVAIIARVTLSRASPIFRAGMFGHTPLARHPTKRAIICYNLQ